MGYQPSTESSMKKTIRDPEELLSFFADGYKTPEEVSIGMELETHGIHTDTLKPLRYLEKNGLRNIQLRLIEEAGWEIENQEGRYIKSLKRGDSHLTLESSQGTFELAGRVHQSIHGLARELRMHQHEMREISKLFHVAWLGMGFQPFAAEKEIAHVPLRRFTVANHEKPRQTGEENPWGRICSVQGNVDYLSEEDACRKFQTLIRLAPFMAAMFANAPLKGGKDSGFVSYRLHVFREALPWRTGIRKEFLTDDFTLRTWRDFCMKVPMITIVRDGKWIPVKNMTFAQFLRSGYEGFAPEMEDWIMHVSFVYTDARIKNYIELRVCDSLPPPLIPSLQAIIKAFVYHPQGKEFIDQLTKNWTFADFDCSYQKIARDGLQAVVRKVELLEYCKEILTVATKNLQELDVRNEDGEDESVHLKAIKEFVFVNEQCPGAWVREKWKGEWKENPYRLIEWSSFDPFFAS